MQNSPWFCLCLLPPQRESLRKTWVQIRGEGEWKTKASVLIASQEHWSKPCTHENKLYSLDFSVSKSHKLPFCFFFFFFKSVYILQLIGEKILIHYFTTWIFLMLRNVIEILMRSQSALADSPLSLLLLYLKNKKNNPIVSCCTIEANSFIHSTIAYCTPIMSRHS